MRRLALLFMLVGCGANPAVPCTTEECEPIECVDERCDGAIDDDCDGVIDEDCDCVDGDERRCLDGTDVGACFAGVERCASGAWQPCAGRIDPVDEQCNGVDDDCDGDSDGPASAAASCGVVAHAIGASCEGRCSPICEPAFGDCNDTYEDGCEADLGVSSSCGACGTQCATGEFCELGTCTSVPGIVWTTAFGPNQPYALELDALGRTNIVSEIETPITFDGQTIPAPTTENMAAILVARIDESGGLDWARTIGPKAIGVDGVLGEDGTFYVSGSSTAPVGSIPVGPAFLAAYDASGGVVWATSTSAGRLVEGAAGVDIRQVGLLHRIDQAGAAVSTRALLPNDFAVSQLSDGSNVVEGITTTGLDADCSPVSDQTRTFHLARLAVDGTCALLEGIAISSDVDLRGARPRPGGGFVIQGRGPGTLTIDGVSSDVPLEFTLALDTQLGLDWIAPHGGFLRVDARGNVYAFDSSSPPSSMFLRSFRSDGVMRWEIEIANAAGLFPGTVFDVAPDGRIGFSVPRLNGEPTVNGVAVPSNPMSIVVLEAK